VIGSDVGGNPHNVFHGFKKERKKGEVVVSTMFRQSLFLPTQNYQHSSTTHHDLFIYGINSRKLGFIGLL
jgi:hypothetical protein